LTSPAAPTTTTTLRRATSPSSADATGDETALEFRDRLFAAGILVPTGVDGVYGRSAVYERIVATVRAEVSRLGGGCVEEVHFPPVLARPVFDRSGYLVSFPDLMGSVHVFEGDDKSHAELLDRYARGGDWAEILTPADIVLCSAACHAVYPMCTGRLPVGGRRIEIVGWCYRHEPSSDPVRMQAFRMHELVYVGEPDTALAHRDGGLARGMELLQDLGLDMRAVVANDPFFGRRGAILADTQLEEAAKVEGVTPIVRDQHPTAVMSSNYAHDYFGTPFGIETADGSVAHSSCVAFGLDRIALALLATYGLDVACWPRRLESRVRN
jgi:seryl-tRNA synthetase